MRQSDRKWLANPQAMSIASRPQRSGEHQHLGGEVDPDTWLTPRWILDHLGKFDLDPCAAQSNPAWIGAAYQHAPPSDGLTEQWTGRVFCNPPFSDSRPWIIRHAGHGSGITLVAASVESKVWREIVWKRAAGIFLLHGRTRFCRPDGSTTTGRPLRSIALIGWGVYDAAVLEVAPFAGVFLRSWDSR